MRGRSGGVTGPLLAAFLLAAVAAETHGAEVPADSVRAAATPADGALAAEALADSTRAAPEDSAAAGIAAPSAEAATTTAAGAGDSLTAQPPARKGLSGERPARIPENRPPWTRLLATGDTLVVDRNEIDRVGVHEPLEFLSRLPGAAATEAAATIPVGAVATGGSFATVAPRADGFVVRLPRLEGRDFSQLLLDRLGPGPDFIPVATGPGEFRVFDSPERGFGSPGTAFAPAEPVADSSRSRFGATTGGYGFAGGGISFSDRRGRLSYGFGVDNTRAERSGGIDYASTRLTMLDAAWAAGFGRLAVSTRNASMPIGWKDGRRTSHFDQSIALSVVAGDTLGPAWALQAVGSDDRHSGSALPGIEFKRKGLGLTAEGWQRPMWSLWWRLHGEHDWFTVRHPGGSYTPRVIRAQGEVGTHLGRGMIATDLALALRVSDRHAPRPGGRAELVFALPGAFALGLGAGRTYFAPTYDQEVLVPGNPPAEPERHDELALRLTREGGVTFGLMAVRRAIAFQPFVSAEISDRPWPQFLFTERESRLWDARGQLAFTGGPLGLAAGVWASRLFPDGGSGESSSDELAPFVPEGTGRVFASLRMSLFGGDLIIMPRAELIGVGERRDFAGERLAGYGRLDAAIVGVVAGDVDLEFWMRNMLSQNYALAVVNTESGGLYVDSGRMGAFALRWRFLN